MRAIIHGPALASGRRGGWLPQRERAGRSGRARNRKGLPASPDRSPAMRTESQERRLTEFEIRRAPAGPFVNVLTISGPVENGAQEQLRAELADPGLTSKH